MCSVNVFGSFFDKLLSRVLLQGLLVVVGAAYVVGPMVGHGSEEATKRQREKAI